jgi:predicted phosphodiesterase
LGLNWFNSTHAGDVYSTSVLDELGYIAPVLTASGDDDPASLLSDTRVNKRYTLKIENKILWLVHHKSFVPMRFSWLPDWCENGLDAEQDIFNKPDIVVFSHEHRTLIGIKMDRSTFVLEAQHFLIVKRDWE